METMPACGVTEEKANWKILGICIQPLASLSISELWGFEQNYDSFANNFYSFKKQILALPLGSGWDLKFCKLNYILWTRYPESHKYGICSSIPSSSGSNMNKQSLRGMAPICTHFSCCSLVKYQSPNNTAQIPSTTVY